MINVTVRFYNDNEGSLGTIIDEFVGFDISSENFISSDAIPLPAPVLLAEGTNMPLFCKCLGVIRHC
ncbi:MAG: hypothetical protein PF436_08650 [Prolixibacteraceae bacterium]|jgi:hypothetical protein|nr:hypothetical protein [Prolixibacteraceae bacterium]